MSYINKTKNTMSNVNILTNNIYPGNNTKANKTNNNWLLGLTPTTQTTIPFIN